ncbi:signal peptidase I [Actinoplanes campanulatus]|uniref:Signal peptidase I n=1 Tax=Actinoplanes campanulatus TaxID=113559 RepID=A0A7W5FFA6_9ACTN|nr:S26 family signal peptidase [Actinoplanes campanulatus]MBB3096175.1 signal peptidase I [Actinoplanes campanulatus]GGN14274.1 hypothetical protein GCM10010109_25590 [Actinoplanes campanulatus]GID36731.1 hypothetical protein Aca09nite_32370 [Actinoplanes campanulatus]
MVGGVLALLAAAGVLASARRRLLLIDVVGDSMSPAFKPGDRLLVRRTRRLRRGDVVIAHHPDGDRRTGAYVTTWLVKRLAALPGDPAPESVAHAGRTVPPGMGVLLGDHPESIDSRVWGFIPLTDVAGVVMGRLRSAG